MDELDAYKLLTAIINKDFRRNRAPPTEIFWELYKQSGQLERDDTNKYFNAYFDDEFVKKVIENEERSYKSKYPLSYEDLEIGFQKFKKDTPNYFLSRDYLKKALQYGLRVAGVAIGKMMFDNEEGTDHWKIHPNNRYPKGEFRNYNRVLIEEKIPWFERLNRIRYDFFDENTETSAQATVDRDAGREPYDHGFKEGYSTYWDVNVAYSPRGEIGGILETLAHELIHHWEYHKGTLHGATDRKDVHDKQFAQLAEQVKSKDIPNVNLIHYPKEPRHVWEAPVKATAGYYRPGQEPGVEPSRNYWNFPSLKDYREHTNKKAKGDDDAGAAAGRHQ